jgi:hypothetical protein
LTNGYILIVLATVEAQNYMSTISLSGFPETSQVVPSRQASRPRSRPVAAGGAYAGQAKKFRRALPERSRPESGN